MSPAGFPDLPSGWSWNELGTLCINIDDGDWIETKDQGGSDYRLLQVSNIGVGTFRETNKFRFISQSTFDRIRCTEIQPNHVLVSRMPDPIGRAWCVEVLAHRAVTAVDVAIVETDPSRLLPKYCAYYLNSPLNLRYAGSRASGTTRLRITRRDLSGFPIPVPEIKVQERIVGLLSAYDELIENNARRIEILQEMAQAIYREWFVEFRYPGHEDVPLVDSELGPIPEGWTVSDLGSVCTRVQAGGTPSRKNPEFWDDGVINWFRTTELQDGFLFDSSEKISQAGLEGSSAKMFEAGSILMAIYGSPTVGRLGILTRDATCNQAALALVPDETVLSHPFLYQTLTSLREHFNSIAQGAAQQNISKATVSGTLMMLPPRPLVDLYDQLAVPIWDLTRTLTEELGTLRETRDLLLPRLMSGEIDVSGLDIELADASV